jgi:uncharacterized caspase-like protein
MNEDCLVTASEAGTWHAVVIGVDGYGNVIPELRGAVRDALAFADFLVTQLQIPAANVRLLVTPHETSPVPAAAPGADAAAIRTAFAEVQAAAGEGDHVVLYYAGHGVRVSREGDDKVWMFGLAPADFAMDALDRMITSVEITHFLDALTGQGAQVIGVFDCCHSGGAPRDPDATCQARGIAGTVTAEASAALDYPGDEVTTQDSSAGASGWVRRPRPEQEEPGWVMMSACRADQVAWEVVADDNHLRGAFTVALLRALHDVATPAQAAELRWRDLLSRVRGAMPTGRFVQLPTVEGIVESPVFGGHLLPFGPESTVAIEAGARTRRPKPGSGIRPLNVRLTDLPDDVVRAVTSALEASEVRISTADAALCDVEVVRWEDAIPAWKDFRKKDPQPGWVGKKGGWVLVPFQTTRTLVSNDDVIAYLPPVDASRDAATVGGALARGLSHYARYLEVMRRTHGDPILDPYLEVTLWTDPESEDLDDEQPDSEDLDDEQPESEDLDDAQQEQKTPNPAGDHEVAPDQSLWVEIRVKEGLPGGLLVGLLACSSDGKIELVWPQGDDSRMGLRGEDEADPPAWEVKRVGRGADQPLSFEIRPDQASSSYTLKVIAYANPGGSDPVDLEHLAQASTVQDVVAQALLPGSEAAAPKGPLPGAAWVTRELPIRLRDFLEEDRSFVTMAELQTTDGAGKARLVISSEDSGALAGTALSPDEVHELTWTDRNEVKLREASSGIELWSKNDFVGTVSAAAFAPDFTPDRPRLYLWFTGVKYGGTEPPFRVWDIEAGEYLTTVLTLGEPARAAVTSSSEAGKAPLSRRRPGMIPVRAQSAAFAPDGRSIRVVDGQGTVICWDGITGAPGKDAAGSSASSASPRWSVEVDRDGVTCVTRVSEAATREVVCRLVTFNDGTWAVVDQQGRYDATNAGDIEGLYWVVGLEPIALSQLKARYYQPHLLSKLLGFDSDALCEVATFTTPKLFPRVALFEVDGDTLRLCLTDRGGGFGPVRVAVNQAEVFEIGLVDPTPGDGVVELLVNGKAAGGDISGELTGKVLTLVIKSARFATSGARINVTAFNQEGYLSSRMVGADDAPDPDAAEEHAALPASKLHAIVVGVSRYADERIDLTYAAKDARAFAHALELAATPLFGGDGNVTIQLLTADEPGDTRAPTTAPTRDAIDRAFTRVAEQAGENDVLVVFLAGHGGTFKDEFLYLTSAARKDTWCSAQAEVRKLAAISDGELFGHLRAIKANKRVLILDACESGAVLDHQSSSRGTLSTAQELALERLNDRMGFFLLAGAPANAASLEARRYEQGLLTYSLLEGLRTMDLRKDRYVDVADLLSYAADRVPGLASAVGGVQRPVMSMVQVGPKSGPGASTRSAASRSVTGTFDVGQLAPEDRKKIPLKVVPTPMAMPTSFQDELELFDVLDLGALLDDVLRDMPTQIDLRRGPCLDAYGLTGRYRSDESGITVQIRVRRNGEAASAAMSVRGTVAEKQRLAEDIAARLLAITRLVVPA